MIFLDQSEWVLWHHVSWPPAPHWLASQASWDTQDVPGEILTRGNLREAPQQLPDAANILWQCVSEVHPSVWYPGSQVPGAAPGAEVTGDSAGPPGLSVQVPRQTHDLPVQHSPLLRDQAEGEIISEEEAGLQYHGGSQGKASRLGLHTGNHHPVLVEILTMCLKDITEKYLSLPASEESTWHPGLDYYHKLVSRMVSSLDPTVNVFPRMDWRCVIVISFNLFNF